MKDPERGALLHPLLIDAKETSRLLDLGLDGVYGLIRSGELPAVRIASRGEVEPRKLRIPYAAVAAYVERLVSEQRSSSDRPEHGGRAR